MNHNQVFNPSQSKLGLILTKFSISNESGVGMIRIENSVQINLSSDSFRLMSRIESDQVGFMFERFSQNELQNVFSDCFLPKLCQGFPVWNSSIVTTLEPTLGPTLEFSVGLDHLHLVLPLFLRSFSFFLSHLSCTILSTIPLPHSLFHSSLFSASFWFPLSQLWRRSDVGGYHS